MSGCGVEAISRQYPPLMDGSDGSGGVQAPPPLLSRLADQSNPAADQVIKKNKFGFANWSISSLCVVQELGSRSRRESYSTTFHSSRLTFTTMLLPLSVCSLPGV